ncbi:MAG: HEAT repeat domain-containing protein [Nitrospirota bacterium]
MNGAKTLVLILLTLLAAAPAQTAEQALFGPVRYDVKERYGKENIYTASFPASEAVYLIKIQNGERPGEKPDHLEFSLNGVKVLQKDSYLYRYLACFVRLKGENTIVIGVRDQQLPGFRRPAALPRNVVVTVLPASARMRSLEGVFGLHIWDDQKDPFEVLLKIKNPEAERLAVQAMDLRLDTQQRQEALRKLSALNDRSSHDYLRNMYADPVEEQDVRAEAGFSLALFGDTRDIPILMRGVIDPGETISMAASRGLSLFPEADTQDLLITTLEQMDNMRKGAVIRNIARSGWKPVNAMMRMADSKDPHNAGIALHLLGGMDDPRAVDYLLQRLDGPDNRDVRSVISALSETRDPRAAERLLALANDPVRRAGKEVELAEALASKGDQRAVRPIAEMMDNVRSNIGRSRMNTAYKRLTGYDYEP